MPDRKNRRSQEASAPDQRASGQLDRDRILYSPEFRRLSGVTQVVSPGQEEIFHNRLTHTMKVAQVARRLAEKFLKQQPEVVQTWGEIDPDVVEAASLAHDLGHPPFGHLAETELDQCIRDTVVRATLPDGQPREHPLPDNRRDWDAAAKQQFDSAEGYEGNAQSFRIISRLAVRRDPDSEFGLDLTRATLNATLKYPLLHQGGGKYGAYRVDSIAFDFARDGGITSQGVPSIEAQIMDWADDITFSVHDVEDFYLAGRIPLDRLILSMNERDTFREEWLEPRWAKIATDNSLSQQMTAATIINSLFPSHKIQISGPYDGTRQRRAQIYEMSSSLIGRFVSETKLVAFIPEIKDGLCVPEKTRAMVAVLKQLIWYYVIHSHTLAAHQYGQREVIRTLFRILYEAHGDQKYYLFPAAFQDAIKQLPATAPACDRARRVADAIASLTDQQAIRLYQRLTASSQGSVLDPIVR